MRITNHIHRKAAIMKKQTNHVAEIVILENHAELCWFDVGYKLQEVKRVLDSHGWFFIHNFFSRKKEAKGKIIDLCMKFDSSFHEYKFNSSIPYGL